MSKSSLCYGLAKNEYLIETKELKVSGEQSSEEIFHAQRNISWEEDISDQRAISAECACSGPRVGRSRSAEDECYKTVRDPFCRSFLYLT